MMRRFGLFAGLVSAATAAYAAEPTWDQLLATPTATEIVAQWKAVCFDHAGDMRAQRRAVEELGLTWPYQAMFDDNRELRSCMMVSATEPTTTLDSLFTAVTASIAPLALSPPVDEDDGRIANATIGESNYEIGVFLSPDPENPTAVVALNEWKRRR